MKNRNVLPSFEKFCELRKKYTNVPLTLTVPGDIDTPVSLYLKIKNYSPYSFLLESALQSGASGRYSFIGFNPLEVVRLNNGKLRITKDGVTYNMDDDPVEYLRSLLADFSVPPGNQAQDICTGLVGFFGYDSVRLFENIPDSHEDIRDFDDVSFMLMDSVLIYDHFSSQISIVVHAGSMPDNRKAYDQAEERVRYIYEIISEGNRFEYRPSGENGVIDFKPGIPKNDFKNMVLKAKDYIEDGDAFQIVLSQRFSTPVSSSGFDIYRELRRLNPSPYLFFLKIDETEIAGSSPEVLVRMTDGVAVTRPLAGTRRRGETLAEDRITAEELLADEKERAEHVMLVDLGRNDLGRFCEFNSIKVAEFMGIEYYSHVMHIVSEVTGKIAEGYDAFDLFSGCFPAGTVSGAPKIRAMEIIDELEPVRRGIYAGSVGHFDFSGNMDTCIAIRTIIIRDQTAYIQAGAGIVADSDPDFEYNETIHKAKALMKAVASAEGKSCDFDD